MILTESEVRSFLYNAGFRNQSLNLAVAIAQCESGFDTNAWNQSSEDSRGLMQINVAPDANPQYQFYNLFDPQINTQVAFEIYTNAGNSFRAWTCGIEILEQNKTLIFGIVLATIIGIALFSE